MESMVTCRGRYFSNGSRDSGVRGGSYWPVHKNSIDCWSALAGVGPNDAKLCHEKKGPGRRRIPNEILVV